MPLNERQPAPSRDHVFPGERSAWGSREEDEVAQIPWRITGDELDCCNCAWGCPCQFNAPPTHGRCEALVGLAIRVGQYGDTRLDGVRFAKILQWPGPLYEGKGTQQIVIDANASGEQRAALLAIDSGKHGGAMFEVFAAICPTVLPAAFARIDLEIDRARRVGRLGIPDIGESEVQPIKNPVTGEEHRARIVLPDGFEYKEAEMGNAVRFWVRSGGLSFEHTNSYAQLNEFDWANH